MKLRWLPLLFLISAFAAASVSTSSAQLTELWLIGEDDNGQSEFEIESAGDDFFYLEDGDYTNTDPPGEFWEDGPEEWNDGIDGNEIGFERALTAGDPTINVYFQLNGAQAEPGTTFQFDIEFRAAEAGSTHDIELSLNGTPFRAELGVVADGGTEALLTDTFLGIDVGTVEVPNVLTIERTDGAGAWIQIDYLGRWLRRSDLQLRRELCANRPG